MHYIYSTLTCDNLYVDYNKSTNLNISVGKVLIKGGANVATPGMRNAITPLGAVTAVNDEQLELLEKNTHFKDHVEKGFIRIDRQKIKLDKAVKDLKNKDEAAPKVKKDLEALKVKEYKLGD